MTWIATQARAHYKNGEPQFALSLMEEVVQTRAKCAFHEDHPIYWEVTYRIGLFLFAFAKANRLPDRTEDCWRKGEMIVRDALVWRARRLGPDNPQTSKAYKLLKQYLAMQGKSRDAKGLLSWYRAAAGCD